MRLRGKRDANHAAIVAALRAAGRSVLDLGNVGGGCPDLLVGLAGRSVLLEVKAPKGKLTDDQRVFMAEWRGTAVVVRSAAEAIAATMATTTRGE